MTSKGVEHPTYAAHDEVRCRGCGKSLARVQEHSYPFLTAPWMKVCKGPCYTVTWYSIKPREASWG